MINSLKFCSCVVKNIVENRFGLVIQKRYRYHADKVAKRPLLRRYGYDDNLPKGGPLPRLPSGKKLPMPEYKPANAWSEQRALFGQNDYIDILGNEHIHPIRLQYHIPSWLRGIPGSEYHMLIRKRKMFGQSEYPKTEPSRWRDLQKRIKYLYRYMNQKTKQPGVSKN